MRDTPKGDGSVLEKDRKEEKLKSEDSTRNNLEKGEKIVTRQFTSAM